MITLDEDSQIKKSTNSSKVVSLGARTTYEFNNYKFNVDITIDREFDPIRDIRDMMKFYQEKLIRSRVPQKSLSKFDRKILKKKRFKKEELHQYFSLLQNYARIFQSHIASYIPMQQGHLLEQTPSPDRELTLEMRLTHLYWQHDSSDGISSRQLANLPPEERKRWHIEECLYLEVGECTQSKLVVTIDTSHLFRKFISPIFLKQGKYSDDLLWDFLKDHAHEVEHLLRLPQMKSLIDFETTFYSLPEDQRKRDFYVKDILALSIEEGIANYAVYTDFPFHLLGKTVNKSRKKIQHLLRVANPELYVEKNLSIETYEKDGAGTYYIGEAACYLIAMLLEKKHDKKYINASYNGDDIDTSDFASVLVDQRLHNKSVPILLASSYEQYLPTYRHIHSLSKEKFLEELYEAQESLGIKHEDKIFTPEFIARITEHASNIPAVATVPKVVNTPWKA